MIFLAIAVPSIGVLAVLGLPFSHTLLWLYVLPPGVLAWLTIRPALESKRLPELVLSQFRYLLEPLTSWLAGTMLQARRRLRGKKVAGKSAGTWRELVG
jgi:hypothetical protein